MSMKKTDLEKNKMLKSMNALKGTAIPDRFGKASAVLDRKEQRKLDQAAGLIPFACKLPGDLVAKLRAEAEKKDISVNELLETMLSEVLNKALKS
jgi:hypothetical protein